MKLKNIILVILAMVLVSVITVGITVAYLTDTDKVDNVITLGDVDIKLREYERVSVDTPNASAEAQVQTFNDNKPLLPAVVTKDFDYATKGADVNWDADKDGNKIKPNYTSSIWDPADINNEVDKMVFVENTGKSDAYVRVFFAFEAGNYTSFTRFKDMVHINLNDAASEWTWEWNPALATSDKGGNYFIATATYLPILKSGEFTTISLSQIALDPTAINKDVLAFGEKYEVSVFVQGIQTVGFDNSDQALTKGFGDDIPFTNLKFVTAVDLKTALHYLNGDKTSDVLVGTATVSNDKVSSVTFGLAKDHYADVSGYKGVLTTNGSEENKFTAFTYYVQNADGKYDIYVLSDEGEIYAPKNCDSLFLSMSSLSTVDTSNLNVSGTTSMKWMFRNCANLKSINVSEWDVSNVTDMTYMFYNDSALDTLDVSNWNVSAVKKMMSMFHNCSSLGALEVSGWKVNSVTDISNIFEGCSKIKTLAVDQWADSLKGRSVKVTAAFYKCSSLVTADISNWNIIVSGAMTNMLRGCSSLTTPLNFSGWDVSAVTKMDGVFRGCQSLTKLDLGSWNTAAVTTMESMFRGCSSFTSLDVSNLNTAKVTDMESMFDTCSALASLDVSNFNTANVTTMKSMFSGCSSLTSLDLSAFNTSKVKDMSSMFASCSSMTEITLGAGWSTAEVTTMHWMFRNCSSLASLDVRGWNVSKVTTMNSMFAGCTNLTALDPSQWNVTKLENTALMFNRCDKIKVFDLSGWNPQSLTNIGQMFLDCYALEKIYVGYEWPIDQITSTNSVFRNSKKLEGGDGTKFSEYGEKGKSFAHIDGGAENPGYFTYKPAENTTPEQN